MVEYGVHVVPTLRNHVVIFNLYLADTDIADIYLASYWSRYQYADTDIRLTGTDISISVSAKYISKPIYRSKPNNSIHIVYTLGEFKKRKI